MGNKIFTIENFDTWQMGWMWGLVFSMIVGYIGLSWWVGVPAFVISFILWLFFSSIKEDVA